MEEVIAVSFRDRHRAAQAFNLLWQMNDKLVIELDDAVIVHRDRYGNLEYDQELTSTLDRAAYSRRPLGRPARLSRARVIGRRRECGSGSCCFVWLRTGGGTGSALLTECCKQPRMQPGGRNTFSRPSALSQRLSTTSPRRFSRRRLGGFGGT